MSKVIQVDDAGEYGKSMERFRNKPVTPAAIKQAQDCGCDASAGDAKFGLPGAGLGRSKDESNSEENYGTQYDPERPLRPGEDVSAEDEEIPVDEATDKEARYEAGYAALNAAMEKHKKEPTPENKASLEAAEKSYSAARKSALYKGKDDKPWVPYDHSKEPEGYEGGGGNKKPAEDAKQAYPGGPPDPFPDKRPVTEKIKETVKELWTPSHIGK